MKAEEERSTYISECVGLLNDIQLTYLNYFKWAGYLVISFGIYLFLYDIIHDVFKFLGFESKEGIGGLLILIGIGIFIICKKLEKKIFSLVQKFYDLK